MMRSILAAAAAALMLSACGQGSGPPLPATQEGALNAPSEQSAQMAQRATVTPEVQAQLTEQMHEYLNRSATANASGMTAAPGFEDEISDLMPGTDHRWQVNLVGGTNYRIIGACDNDCSNLDLELIDSRGGVVASDMAPDDFPVVNFTPQANGSYIVRVLLQTCTVAPCYVGARVLTNGGGAVQPAASSTGK